MKLKRIAAALLGGAVWMLAGCSLPSLRLENQVPTTDTQAEAQKKASEVTPTPTPTPLPTNTPTPIPTPTPAPRIIGNKSESTASFYMTNNTNKVLREMKVMDPDIGDWSSNMIPLESSIRAGEQVQVFFTPSETSEVYYLRFVDEMTYGYEIYNAYLTDVENAILRYDDQTGEIYMSYMSKADKGEKDTRGDTTPGSGSSQSTYDSESQSGSSDYSGYNETYTEYSTDSSSESDSSSGNYTDYTENYNETYTEYDTSSDQSSDSSGSSTESYSDYSEGLDTSF